MPPLSDVAPYAAQIGLLREIAALAGLPFEEKLTHVLSKTAELLGLDVGFFSHIEGDTYTVRAVHPVEGGAAVGDTFALSDTYCEITAGAEDIVRIDDVTASPHAGHPCYGAFGLAAYIGAPVYVGDAFYGTLSFASEAPRAVPFTDADAGLLRLLASWIGMAADRYREADAARQSERRLAQVLDAAPEAVILTRPDRTIEYVNPAFEELFGCDSDDAIGHPTLDFYADPEDFKRQGRIRFNRAGTIGGDAYIVEYRRPDGTTFLGETVGGPLKEDSEVTGMLGFIRDVTEREAARKREASASKAEAEAVRAKERFLANMSHEMRTPLNAVLGLSHLLGQTPLSTDQAGLLDGVRSAADTLLGVIDDLLDFARLGAGRLPIESIPFELQPIVAGVRTMLQSQADAKGLALRFHVAPDVPATLVGDPTRMRQILLNLVSNAVKFTSIGSVRVSINATPAADGVRLQIEVADTGVGIPYSRQEAIFDPFTQAASDAARRFGGTGLGLAIVKELVERQGGRIGVESAEGRGSTFRVELPSTLPARSEPPAPQPAASGPADLTGLRVLLVEDNEMNRLVARRTLETWGVVVAEARDGREAVRAVARADEAPIDVVLMDLQMPEMDGVSATRYIRDVLGVSSDELPILALTASVLASQHEEVLSAGLDDFILKPFDPDGLRERIAAWGGRTAPDGAPDPAVDPDEISRYAGGDPELASQMAGLFITNGHETADRLAAAFEADDHATVGTAAHELKGQASYVGAGALTETLTHLLAAVREGDRVAIASDVPVALRQYEAAASELARLYPQPGLTSAAPASA